MNYGPYSKGDIDTPGGEYGQYVQSTKLDESITALLEEMESGGPHVIIDDDTREFYHQTLTENNYVRHNTVRDFQADHNVISVKRWGMDAYLSGCGFGNRDRQSAISMIENMELPDGFQPDFSGQSVREYETDHSLLGPTDVRVYAADYQGKKMEWHVAHNPSTDTVWLDRITTDSNTVTQFGSRQDIVLAGALSAKPTDYLRACRGMQDGIDIMPVADSSKYVSIKPTLDRMPWVKDYRQARFSQDKP